ncbi:MAG: hypothetical protein ABIH46_03520 [Chloroflexota bacterium]
MATKSTSTRIVLLDPLSEADLPTTNPAQRIADPNGKAIGFLFNGHNAGALLFQSTIEKMTKRFSFSSVVNRVKANLGAPSTPETIGELASTCDTVVLGVGA